MELRDRVVAALDAGAATATTDLQQLLLDTGGEHCHRRERITYLLQRYLTLTDTSVSAPSTTHRFKQAFASHAFNYEDNGTTRSITAKNLTDEDVPVIQLYAPHLLEELPKTPAVDLEKHSKPELQKLYAEKLGQEPAAELTKAELIKALTEPAA